MVELHSQVYVSLNLNPETSSYVWNSVLEDLCYTFSYTTLGQFIK